MIAAALLAGLASQSNVQLQPPPVVAERPVVRAIDWDALPPLPWRRIPRATPRMTSFVASEMQRTACPRPDPVAGRVQLQVDVAVLIGDEGVVRATIPRAIACSVVEQYAAGLILSFARNNLIPRLVSEGGWYRASMVFDWAA